MFAAPLLQGGGHKASDCHLVAAWYITAPTVVRGIGHSVGLGKGFTKRDFVTHPPFLPWVY